jgi:putative restriction endonuclease
MANQYQRAFRAWPVLTETAAHHTKITYVGIGDRLGIHHRPVRYVLSVIQDYCLEEKLPPLTILVVNQRFRQPGEGFIAWDVDDLEQGYDRVYAYPWDQLPNPFAFSKTGETPEELARQLVRRPQESAVVYRLINNRGFVQAVFRLELLLAYNRRCAFCGLSLTQALQAAHIIPWREASISQRLDPANGLLLCATHHALFDANILTVSMDRCIHCTLTDDPGVAGPARTGTAPSHSTDSSYRFQLRSVSSHLSPLSNTERTAWRTDSRAAITRRPPYRLNEFPPCRR